MRSYFARVLHKAADVLDGSHASGVRLVQETNRYIGRTERYVCALEKLLPPEVVSDLREDYSRFDTKPLVEAGVWSEDVW